MSSLTSTAPAAFNQLYTLLAAAGATQNPAVSVFSQELVQYEPASYVLLKGIENHRFEWAALGSYAQYETYDIVGEATVFQGNIDPQTVIVATYNVFQDIVMSTVLANSGSIPAGSGPVLGSAALQAAGLMWIIPGFARYTGEPGTMNGAAGFAGTVEFSYSLKARITT